MNGLLAKGTKVKIKDTEPERFGVVDSTDRYFAWLIMDDTGKIENHQWVEILTSSKETN